MGQEYPPNLPPPVIVPPREYPPNLNPPVNVPRQDFSPRYLLSNGFNTNGYGYNNNNGGFAGQVLSFTRDVAAIGVAGRVLGNVLGVASEFTGARIPLGGGYNQLERNQVRFFNSQFERGIAYNNAYTNGYNGYAQGGYGYGPRQGGYGYIPQNAYGYGPQQGNYGYSAQDGYGYGPQQSGYGYGPQSRNAGRSGKSPLGEFIDRVYFAHVHGSTEEMQAAIDFANQAGIVQRDGAIHFPNGSYLLPNGEAITYRGEVLPPAIAAQNLDRVLTTMGIAAGRPAQSGAEVQPQKQTTGAQAGPKTDAAPATQPTGGSTAEEKPEPKKAESADIAALQSPNGKPAQLWQKKGYPFTAIPMAENQVEPLQRLLKGIGLGEKLETPALLHPETHGIDGKLGFRTNGATEQAIRAAGLDPKDINFMNPTPQTQQFIQYLASRQPGKAQTAAVAPKEPTPAPTQSQPEQPLVPPAPVLTQEEKNSLARSYFVATGEMGDGLLGNGNKGGKDNAGLRDKVREFDKDNGLVRDSLADDATIGAMGAELVQRAQSGNVKPNHDRDMQRALDQFAQAGVIRPAGGSLPVAQVNGDLVPGTATGPTTGSKVRTK